MIKTKSFVQQVAHGRVRYTFIARNRVVCQFIAHKARFVHGSFRVLTIAAARRVWRLQRLRAPKPGVSSVCVTGVTPWSKRLTVYAGLKAITWCWCANSLAAQVLELADSGLHGTALAKVLEYAAAPDRMVGNA